MAERSSSQKCFNGTVIQAVHKYADLVLLLLLGGLGWWLHSVDARITKESDLRQLLQRDMATVAASAIATNTSILQQLERMDKTITIMDQRIYVLIGRDHQHKAMP